MPGKRTTAQKVAPYVRLGLVDKPDGPGASLDPRLADAAATLLALGKELDLDLRLTARRVPKPGEAEEAWLSTWESLDLDRQVHVLQLSARFGPHRVAAGQSILERWSREDGEE